MYLDYEKFAARVGLLRSLLVVAPHPDDETVGCGGLIALASRAGVEVRCVVVTDGGASHLNSSSWPRARLVAVRRLEAEEALLRLGARIPVTALQLPDAETSNLPAGISEAARDRVTSLIDECRPELVLTTWRREPHCDHQFSYQLVRDAVARAVWQPRVVEYMVWTRILGAPRDWPTVGEAFELKLDVSSVQTEKHYALAAHATQLGKVIQDDPSGFHLMPQHLEELMMDHESYFEARGPSAPSY